MMRQNKGLRTQGRKQACGALVALLSAVALLHVAVVQPALHKQQSQRDRIGQLQLELRQLGTARHDLTQLEEHIDRLRSMDSGSQHLLEHATPTLAAADLQNRIKTMVQQKGGQLIRISAKAQEQSEPFIAVSVHLLFKSRIAELRDILHEIKAQQPMLFVRTMRIHDSRSSNDRWEMTMETELRVTSYMKPSKDG